MSFLSPGHLALFLIVLVIVLIIWGPGKLGEVGGALGRGLREFRNASSDTRDHFNNAINGQPQPPVGPPPSAPPPGATPPTTSEVPASPPTDEGKGS